MSGRLELPTGRVANAFQPRSDRWVFTHVPTRRVSRCVALFRPTARIAARSRAQL